MARYVTIRLTVRECKFLHEVLGKVLRLREGNREVRWWLEDMAVARAEQIQRIREKLRKTLTRTSQ